MVAMTDLTTGCTINFCPGCGDIAIWAAFRQAAIEGGFDNTNTALVAGVGCHGHMLNFVKLSGFGSLHGRPIPVATGIKMARHDLNVFVFTGDGDSLAEGTNHFVHAARRNHNITVILHDNAIYGLTTGQTSPRSPHGYISKSTPEGNLDEPLNPCALAITVGATFVGRVFAGDIPSLTAMFLKANAHRGFALVDVLQPCVTFNKLYTHEFYRQNTYQLAGDYDPGNKLAAIGKAMEWGEKAIPLGVLYEEHKPAYEEQVAVIAIKPLMLNNPVTVKDISEELKKYK
jgi:2-oxoglutarate ferredoxin oxidoreductase subunit beta